MIYFYGTIHIPLNSSLNPWIFPMIPSISPPWHMISLLEHVKSPLLLVKSHEITIFGDNNGFQKTASRQETGEIWIRLVNASPVAPSHLAVCPAPCKASRKKHGGINSQVEPRGYARGCIPNIWLSMVQYLYFRILKFHEISIDENKGVQPIHIIYSYIYIR